eukprot:NODE_236_length_13376_cov_0.329367.p2 type:complete len:388 gc:universal NODE_236_length_13376_cov_0.329367:7386-6223(-)
MCRDALVHLLSISRQQLQRIANDLSTQFKPRVHGNKGIRFLHALTDEQKACVKEFIFNFAEAHGEPRPGRQYLYKNARRTRDVTYLWLPSDYTISRLHELYWNSENAIQIKSETFRRLFHDCETIRIRSPRSDMCDTCTTFKNDMKYTESEIVLIALTRDFQEHLNQAKVARLDYNRCKHLANVTCISFDYSQNLVLPQFQDQPSELYFLSLLNIYLFGIYNETKKKQLTYIYREDHGKKGGDNVVSLLIDYIFLLPSDQRRHLILLADNCVGQNKNNTMMKLLAWLCLTGKCDTIGIRFMIKGHTKFSPDAGFGHIKKKYALQDIFTVEQVKALIETSASGNECKVFPGRRFKDYRSKLNYYFDDIPGIRGYQSVSSKKIYQDKSC